MRWNDPDLAIDWPMEIGLEPIVSPKDAAAASFAECDKYEEPCIELPSGQENRNKEERSRISDQLRVVPRRSGEVQPSF